jgi:hypothetical protein
MFIARLTLDVISSSVKGSDRKHKPFERTNGRQISRILDLFRIKRRAGNHRRSCDSPESGARLAHLLEKSRRLWGTHHFRPKTARGLDPIGPNLASPKPARSERRCELWVQIDRSSHHPCSDSQKLFRNLGIYYRSGQMADLYR